MNYKLPASTLLILYPSSLFYYILRKLLIHFWTDFSVGSSYLIGLSSTLIFSIWISINKYLLLLFLFSMLRILASLYRFFLDSSSRIVLLKPKIALLSLLSVMAIFSLVTMTHRIGGYYRNDLTWYRMNWSFSFDTF